MSDHLERVAKNEELFRAVNRRIEDVNEAFSIVSSRFVVLCECGDAACTDTLSIERADYERARSDPTYFVVLPGHELAEVERVVARGDGYLIVKKREGRPAALGRELDAQQ
jgi:hypothetical protein